MFWLLYQLHVNYALHQALKSEKVKNIKYRELNMACDQKLVEVKKESIAKDNRTAEIWNKLGWLLNFFPLKFIFKLLDGKKGLKLYFLFEKLPSIYISGDLISSSKILDLKL